MNGEVKLTARMLRAASFLPWLSAGMTILSAASLLFGHARVPAIAAIVFGVAGCFYGFRIALDTWIFEDLISGALTTEELDGALHREPRPWPDRCRGARRLIVKAALATVLQLAALGFCAAHHDAGRVAPLEAATSTPAVACRQAEQPARPAVPARAIMRALTT
jgi:hypothetical protein